MKSEELVKYWLESSDRDYESMIKNYEAKQYTWALFIGHLVLEKLLKGIYAKINLDSPYPPKIHNLNIIAQKCERIKPAVFGGLILTKPSAFDKINRQYTEEYPRG